MGLAEDHELTTFQVALNFLKNSFKIKNLSIYSAYRVGTQPDRGSSYARPMIVTFNKLSQRNRIWRSRANFTNGSPEQRVRIHADLPKPLREGVQALYKLANAASKFEDFNSAKVRDYQLELNGETYQITDLETVPEPIRPSTLSAPRSDTHLVFYSKHAPYSNHFPSKFTIQEQSFTSMEHFLALKRAEFSGNEELIQRARRIQDPLQAKIILNSLHDDHQEEWYNQIEELVLEGLRAKFTQDRQLHDQLCSTGKLTLGEASTNTRWGIGMDLGNPEVLDGLNRATFWAVH